MRGRGIDRILFHSTLRETSKRETTDKTILAIWIAMFLIILSLVAIL